MLLGQIKQLWRYPVKSLGGESLGRLQINRQGVVGDRHWAVYDPTAPMIRSAKQWPELLSLRAHFIDQPNAEDYGSEVAAVRLANASGEDCDSIDPAIAAEWLSRQLGRTAQLCPREPASNVDFYRLPGARREQDIARELGLGEGEALPDFSLDNVDLATLLAECTTPPGSLYDAYPLHILTTDSLQFIEYESGLQADVRRFRPNILLETASPKPATTEQDWLKAELAIGEVVVSIHSPTLRCSMPSRAQPGFDLQAEPGLPRTIARLANRNLGVNAQVLKAGTVYVGDPVYLRKTD